MKSLRSYVVPGLLASVLLLGACSDESNDTQGNTSSKGDTQEEVTLNMGSWRTEDTAKYQVLIDKFNEEHPNINIEFNPTINTEYNTQLNTALQAGQGPDIFHLRPYAAGLQLADAGFVEPLTDLEGLDAFPDAALQASQSEDGTQYGVPLNLSTTQVFYNVDLFEENGVEVPQSWDELVAAMQTFKDAGVTPLALGTSEGWLLSLTQMIFGPAHFGTEFVDGLLAGEKKFTDPEFVASIEGMNDLTEYFPKNYEGLGEQDMRTMFFTGDAAMYAAGSWEIGLLREMNPDLNFDFFPMPSVDGDSFTVTSWVDGSYAINANSEHKEEAKLFLEFMATEEFGNLFSEEFGMISAHPGVTSNDELLGGISEAVNEYNIPYMWVTNFNSGDPTTKSVVEAEMQGMYLGERQPQEVAEAIQTSAESWFGPFQ